MEAMELKQAYQDKADAQLRDWHIWIEGYKSDPANQDQLRCIKRLEDCQQAARTQLDVLRVAQDERWELAKQAVERAMIELKRVIDEVGIEFAGKQVQLQQSRSHIYAPFYRKG